MGQLGFHVQFEGLIADVETSGFAWLAGLRQGSRLVEVWAASIVFLFLCLLLRDNKVHCVF